MSLHGDQSGEEKEYVRNVYVYHLVMAATSLARSFDREGGSHNPVKDVTVGFGPDRLRMNIYCKEAPGSVIFTEPAAENERDLDSLPEADSFGQNPLSENERARTSLRSRTDTDNAEITLASWLPSCPL